jgi:hypothetical protein
MYSFGRHPPRTLNSFGVAGLLGEECRVFYTPLFSSGNLGRVTDLLTARLKKIQTDEFCLRLLMFYSFFEVQRLLTHKKTGPTLEPITIECGVDSEKTAIGVSFIFPEEHSADFPSMILNVTAGKQSSEFESFLLSLLKLAHRVILRYEPTSKRMEVVSLCGTTGRMEDSELSSPHQIELVTINKDSISLLPNAKEYVDLGDLDYAQLLQQDILKGKEPSPTGEILFKTLIPGGEVLNEERFLVPGDDSQAKLDPEIRISGVTQTISNEGDGPAQLIPADIQTEFNLFDQTLMRIQGEAPEIKNEITSTRAKRWVDGLIGELVTERARLLELAKKMHISVRQKEAEHQGKERALREEIKKRDEFFRQKNLALSRTKEQLSQSNLALEKMKTLVKKPLDDMHYKQKFFTIQKILSANKEENAQLSLKVEEYRSQLNSVQFNTKVRGPSISDFATLQAQFERSQKQQEEIKKVNLHLAEKANSMKRERERTLSNLEEVKDKLDEMSKTVMESKEIENKLKRQVEEMLKSNLNLRKELDKVRSENKNLKMEKAS